MIAELRSASRLVQTGRYAEAVALYRQVLARTPREPEAVHFLGICLARSGRRDEGLRLIERSVELAPRNPHYRQNLGLVLAEAGRPDLAERQFEAAVALHPASATAHNYLGMARQQLGRLEEALASYGEALRLAPDDPATANNLGYCMLQRGDIGGARRWLQRALEVDPSNAMAHLNLGNALRAQGDLQAALESYRRALARAPQLANAHYNLALTQRELGEPAAFASARAALRCDRHHRAAWQLFAELLAPRRFSASDAELAADCEHLLAHTAVEVQDCAEALWSLVGTAPRGRLFHLLLEHALVADEGFEREMRALRQELLGAPRSLELCCAIAQQCFLNEYIWPESGPEAARLDRLETATPLGIAVLAMYRPLRGIARPAAGGEAFDRLWRRVVDEPAKEAALEVPALTPIADHTSREVQAQYEAHPYPRWHRAPAAGAAPLALMLRELFPGLEPAKLAAPHAPRILIAGCGTGRHAAITAQLQPHADILAVDLSRASLAHALRRCGELGLGPIRFAQADILRLGGLDERFDLIECSGVLHHMDDPIAGWRVLLSLLNAGGFMKLGLYSEAGRSAVVAARDMAKGLEPAEARRRILALPASHPARPVARLRDFYCASGVRDLVLHVREQRFTIPRLARASADLGVELLGFELPGRRRALSLDEGHELEEANPDAFASMYQFWIRKP